jgi:hypothetical protein
MITTFATLNVTARTVVVEVHIAPDSPSTTGMYEEFIKDFKQGLNAAAIIIPAHYAEGHVKFSINLAALSPELKRPEQPIVEPPKRLSPADILKAKLAQDKPAQPPTVLGKPVPKKR